MGGWEATERGLDATTPVYCLLRGWAGTAGRGFWYSCALGDGAPQHKPF